MGINESMKKVHLSIWIVNLLKAAQTTQSTTVTWICMCMHGYLHADEFIPDNNWSQIITQEFRQLIDTDNVTQWYEKYLTGNLWKKSPLANQKSNFFLVGKVSFLWTFTELLPAFPWHRDSPWCSACYRALHGTNFKSGWFKSEKELLLSARERFCKWNTQLIKAT